LADPIHLVREIEETTDTAVFYCGINTPLAAISIELLVLFPEDMICQTCLAAYRWGSDAFIVLLVDQTQAEPTGPVTS